MHPPNEAKVKWLVNSDSDLFIMFDKWKHRNRIELLIMERKSPTMIGKLLLQLDGSLGGMNVDDNLVETPLLDSQPMPTQEGGYM